MRHLFLVLLSVVSIFGAPQITLQTDTNKVVTMSGLVLTNASRIIAETELDGPVLAEGSLVSVLLTRSLANPVNIRAWSILGDGSDETAKWNTMMTNYTRPTRFIIPPAEGSGYVASNIKFKSGFFFEALGGAGQYDTNSLYTITPPEGVTNAIFTPFDRSVDTKNVGWMNVTMRGSTNCVTAIDLYRTSYSVVTGCEIFGFNYGAIANANVSNQTYFNHFIRNTISYNYVADLYFDGGANVSWIKNNVFKGTPIGIVITNTTTGLVIAENAAQGVTPGTTTFFSVWSGAHTIRNNWIEACGTGIFATNSAVYIEDNRYGGNVTNQVVDYNVLGYRSEFAPISGSVGYRGRWGNLFIQNDWFTSQNYTLIGITPGGNHPTLAATNTGIIFGYGTNSTVPVGDYLFAFAGNTNGGIATNIVVRIYTDGDPVVQIAHNFGSFNINDVVRIVRAGTAEMGLQINNGGSWANAARMTTNKFQISGHLAIPEHFSAPSTPASGFGLWYNKTNGLPYFKNDDGMEHMLANPSYWINVLDYGADNTGVRDSATAFQAAANATFGKTNSVVFIPPGNYTNTTTTIFSNQVNIIGYGATIRAGGSATRVIQLGADGLSAANRWDLFAIYGVKFFFGANTVSNSIYVAPWITRAKIVDCDFRNTYTVVGASEIYFAGENWESVVQDSFFYPSGSVGSRAITTNPDSSTNGVPSPNSNIRIRGNDFSGLAALVEPAVDIGNNSVIISENIFNRNNAIHLRSHTNGSGASNVKIVNNTFESGNDSTNDAHITYEGQLLGARIEGNYFNPNNRTILGTPYNGLILRPTDGTSFTTGLQYIHNMHFYFTNAYPIFANAADTKGLQYGNYSTPVTSSLDYGPDFTPINHVDNLESLKRLAPISDVAFSSSWNGSLDGATKNAIYDAMLSTNWTGYALMDMVTTVTNGSSQAYWIAPVNGTMVKLDASVFTTSSSGGMQFDINLNGSTMLSTKLFIDQGERSSITSATNAVFSTVNFSAGDFITVDTDVAGTSAAGPQVKWGWIAR